MLDNYNRQILKHLKNNARISFTELAKKVHLTAPAVTERIRKLEENGYIEGYYTKINHSKTGTPINAWVQAKTFTGKEPEFMQAIKSKANILKCYNVTGEKAFLLRVSCTDMEELNTLLEELATISETNTMMILSEVPQD